MTRPILPPPRRYFPIPDGRYHVRAGLRALSEKDVSASNDWRAFQFDNEFSKYRVNKDACRNEAMGKYYLHETSKASVECEVAVWFAKQLAVESPDYFELHQGSSVCELECRLTKETISFDKHGKLQSQAHYLSLFDALSSQVQEDLAIVVLSGESDMTTSLHLCAPNHWSPADKIAKSFVEIHNPIAEIEKVNATAAQIVQAMIYKAPYERFAWGICCDTQLNQHPEPPPGQSAGRSFEDAGKRLWLRVERQTTRGFPDSQAALFTIRTYFLACEDLSKLELEKLSSALDSMTEASRRYKGVFESFDTIQNSLQSLLGPVEMITAPKSRHEEGE